MHSAIYQGRVWHARTAPKKHAFSYKVFMMYLDLDELEQVFSLSRLWSMRKFSPARFKREDYLGSPDISLSQAVKNTVKAQLGETPKGPIRLLTNLRFFGYITNPISCYYCFDEQDSKLDYMVIEVTNTPWGEKQSYVLRCDNGADEQIIDFNKTLHVSPFMPMDIRYQWRGKMPGQNLTYQLINYREQHKVFAAGVDFCRVDITRNALNKVLLRFPFMTMQVIVGIYWQALKLWLKKVPFCAHPDKKTPTSKTPYREGNL